MSDETSGDFGRAAQGRRDTDYGRTAILLLVLRANLIRSGEPRRPVQDHLDVLYAYVTAQLNHLELATLARLEASTEESDLLPALHWARPSSSLGWLLNRVKLGVQEPAARQAVIALSKLTRPDGQIPGVSPASPVVPETLDSGGEAAVFDELLRLNAQWDVGDFPVTIYLSHEEIHDEVEAAVADLLDTAGLGVVARGISRRGSWFVALRAALRRATSSARAQESAQVGLHAMDQRITLAQDATITATLLQNLGPVLTSLQPTRDAVLRLGAVLIVKVDWVVSAHQLTAAQQHILDHSTTLPLQPDKIIAALGLEQATAVQSLDES